MAAASSLQQRIYNTIRDELNSLQLEFQERTQKMEFRLFIYDVAVFIDVSQTGRSVTLYFLSGQRVNVQNEAKLVEAMKEICRRNERLQVGNWELDLQDGEIRFKMSQAYHDDRSPRIESFKPFVKAALSVGYQSFKSGIAAIGAMGVLVGMDVDKDPDGPLFGHCRNGNLDGVKQEIIDKRGNPNITNRKGISPLMAAATKDHAAICEFLIDRGANVNHESLAMDTALSLSIWKRSAAAAKVLLQRGARVDHVDRFGDTPLIDSCKLGLRDLAVDILARPNHMLNHRNKAGKTALTVASEARRDDLVAMLQSRGATL